MYPSLPEKSITPEVVTPVVSGSVVLPDGPAFIHKYTLLLSEITK